MQRCGIRGGHAGRASVKPKDLQAAPNLKLHREVSIQGHQHCTEYVMKSFWVRRFFMSMDRVACPHCGSGQVRLSTVNSFKLSPSIYRCRACKRHFKQGITFNNVAVVLMLLIGFLALLSILTTLLEHHSPEVYEAFVPKLQQQPIDIPRP